MTDTTARTQAMEHLPKAPGRGDSSNLPGERMPGRGEVAGADAERQARLAEIRFCADLTTRSFTDHAKALRATQDDVRFLLSELARVEAELFGAKERVHEYQREVERAGPEAQCAAMREALELAAPHHQGGHSKVGRAIGAALAPDAGKALLERLEKAEAALNEVDDDMSRDRDLWKERAEKAEREREGMVNTLADWKDFDAGRAQAFEECAKVAEKYFWMSQYHGRGLEIAAAIRAKAKALGEGG